MDVYTTTAAIVVIPMAAPMVIPTTKAAFIIIDNITTACSMVMPSTMAAPIGIPKTKPATLVIPTTMADPMMIRLVMLQEIDLTRTLNHLEKNIHNNVTALKEMSATFTKFYHRLVKWTWNPNSFSMMTVNK